MVEVASEANELITHPNLPCITMFFTDMCLHNLRHRLSYCKKNYYLFSINRKTSYQICRPIGDLNLSTAMSKAIVIFGPEICSELWTCMYIASVILLIKLWTPFWNVFWNVFSWVVSIYNLSYYHFAMSVSVRLKLLASSPRCWQWATPTASVGSGPSVLTDRPPSGGTVCISGELVKSMPPLMPASLWTRETVREFKDTVRKNAENVIKIGSLATATVSSHSKAGDELLTSGVVPRRLSSLILVSSVGAGLECRLLLQSSALLGDCCSVDRAMCRAVYKCCCPLLFNFLPRSFCVVGLFIPSVLML